MNHVGIKCLRTFGAALGLATAVGSFGCSVRMNTTAIQCLSEAECLAAGPEFANTTCSPTTKTCVPVNAEANCSTNEECTNRVGDAAICRKSDRRCVPLKTAECQTVMAEKTDYLSDDAIIVGAFTPANDSQLGAMMESAVAFAQIKIRSNAQGLPPTTAGGKRRPLVVVGCNEFGAGNEGLIRAGRHLAQGLQVPVIIGPVDTGNALVIANNVTIPSKVANILPTSQLAALSEIPTGSPTPLIWRMYLSDNEIAELIGDLVEKHLDAHIRTTYAVPTGTGIRVAIIREGNIYGANASAKIRAKLKFNGKDASGNQTDGTFAMFDIGDVRDPVNNPDPDAAAIKQVLDLIAFKPHLVIHASALIGIAKILGPIERSWPTDVPRPLHLAASPSWENQILSQLIGGNVALRKRIIIVRAQTRPLPTWAAWNADFTGRFTDFQMAPISPLVYFLYDSLFVTSFALSAVGNKPLTGENVATAMGLLTDTGTEVDVSNVSDIGRAIGLAANGSTVKTKGIADTHAFDSKTGGIRRNAEIACPKPDPMSRRYLSMGYFYNAVDSRGMGMPDFEKCE